MVSRRRLLASAVSAALASLLALALVPGAASAQAPNATTPCAAWEIEYALSPVTLSLEDTPMGAGDGDYAIGPGRVLVRVQDRDGTPAGRAQMLSYDMRERFTIESHALFWKARVTTDTRTQATPSANACGGAVAEGSLDGRTLRWTTPVTGYRTDGTLTCTGGLCGNFGAPPEGTSELHIPPHAVQFSPFAFGADGKSFTMARTFVTKTDHPKQTAFVTLTGHETRRTCVATKPSCP